MTKKVIEDVKPTRMELLQVKKRKELAVKGHKLLSEKRDALVASFLELIKKRKEKRKELEEMINSALKAIVKAEMVLGEEKVKRLAEAIHRERKLISGGRNIMGVSIPELRLEEKENFSYSLFSTSSEFDESVKKAEELMNKIVEVAEIEASIQLLGREIEKTKRRVNALEYIFIPRLKNTISYIERQLEEMEREDFFRRKRIKYLLGKYED
ncbi:MAG: V-type ATP synthase subunit D [Thermoplasmatales archaeon]|nr:V-type ATP synthase subunit D [Thermoplasmatales archaeon]